MSILATKRSYADLDNTSTECTPSYTRRGSKRSRTSIYCKEDVQGMFDKLSRDPYRKRIPDGLSSIEAYFAHDASAPQCHPHLHPHRISFLKSISFTTNDLVPFVRGFHFDFHRALRMLDPNLWQDNISRVIGDFSERGVPLARLNVTGHSISMTWKQQALQTFNQLYPDHAAVHGAAQCLLASVFANEAKVSLSFFTGGGVRDILLADWCRLYGITPADPVPALLVITTESGKTLFLASY